MSVVKNKIEYCNSSEKIKIVLILINYDIFAAIKTNSE